MYCPLCTLCMHNTFYIGVSLPTGGLKGHSGYVVASCGHRGNQHSLPYAGVAHTPSVTNPLIYTPTTSTYTHMRTRTYMYYTVCICTCTHANQSMYCLSLKLQRTKILHSTLKTCLHHEWQASWWWYEKAQGSCLAQRGKPS